MILMINALVCEYRRINKKPLSLYKNIKRQRRKPLRYHSYCSFKALHCLKETTSRRQPTSDAV